MRALVGHSGFVGESLKRQARFDRVYRSNDFSNFEDEHFDLAVCAGAPAQKWIANRDPDADLANVKVLISKLVRLRCERLVLISTVDVFKRPVGVDEHSVVDVVGLHAYGRHRRMIEVFVDQHFERSLTVRLPGLVGPGLRKNVLFDLLNDNNIDAIDSRGVFQFYPVANLWRDIGTALAARLRLVHLTAEPLRVSDVAGLGFDRDFEQVLDGTPARYDMRTLHAERFGVNGDYQYNCRESIEAIRAYAQSEPRMHERGMGV